MNKHWKRKIPFIILFIIAGVALFGWIVMLLWNALLPGILGVSVINFWQALGILLLSKILFGGFRGGAGWKGRQHMKKHWQQKWEGMSEEERVKFKERCGLFFSPKTEKEEQK